MTAEQAENREATLREAIDEAADLYNNEFVCSTAEAEENEARRAARHNALDALLGLPDTEAQ